MNYIEILNNYKKLEDQLNDSRNFFCFNTQNGRRLIVKIEDKKMCIAINRNFRAVSFKDKTEMTFYDSPIDLIRSYDENSVEITDIFITMSKQEAYDYLQH